MKTLYETLFNAQTVQNTTSTSGAVDIRHCLGYTIRLVYTGSSLGTSAVVKIQYSMDGVTFFDAPNSAPTAQYTVSASGGSNEWHVSDVFYPYVRLSYQEDQNQPAVVTAQLFAKGA